MLSLMLNACRWEQAAGRLRYDMSKYCNLAPLCHQMIGHNKQKIEEGTRTSKCRSVVTFKAPIKRQGSKQQTRFVLHNTSGTAPPKIND